ncbi:MAG TPA: hypothetical protein VK358_05425 [Longimicrobium sp.]|nr:hypothetical protein [Longimicrobium sp.]
MIRARFLLLPALALPAACDGGFLTGEPICPAVVVPSLQVEVVDAGTGASLVPGATGSWATGSESGTLGNVEFSSQYLTAFGPAGRYRVTVQHAGYAVWSRDGVRVNRGTCGPQTVRLRAVLVR